MFDDRLLKVSVGSKEYEGLKIDVSGSKYDNSIANDATVKITNLDRATRDFILTESTPFRQGMVNQKVIVSAGRKSTGYAVVFVGDVFRSTISQPPDIGLTIKCMTGFSSQGVMVSNPQGEETQVSAIVTKAASNLGLKLVNESTDKKIANYSYNGSAFNEVGELNKLGDYNVYIDDDKLVIKDKGKPLSGATPFLSQTTGMIGIPEITEFGVRVKCLFDNNIKVGCAITVQSILNPAVNGTYTVYRLTFDLSNRDTPFYYTVEAMRKL